MLHGTSSCYRLVVSVSLCLIISRPASRGNEPRARSQSAPAPSPSEAKNESSMRHSRCDGDGLSHYPTSRSQKHKSLSAISTSGDRAKADVIQKSHSHTSNNWNLFINRPLCLISSAFSVFVFLLGSFFLFISPSRALPHALRHTSDRETQRGGRAVPRGARWAPRRPTTHDAPPPPPGLCPSLDQNSRRHYQRRTRRRPHAGRGERGGREGGRLSDGRRAHGHRLTL